MTEGLDPLARTATATSEQGTPPPVAAAPESIARFRIERQLGAGAMGVVYAAFDPDLERHVAVKVLRAAPGAVARNRLLREARAMARLSHPNVVTVHEVGTSGDRDYVATELVIGSNLSEWLRAAPRSKREIVDAFLAAGRGLVAAHEAGLVHRDFKPHNVLRSDKGRIAVSDFGLARALQGEEVSEVLPVLGAGDDPGSLEGDLTRTGALVGTPGYMAPEQWEGLEVDAAADQFSFCVALWEALAGQRPFLGKTVEELRAQVQRPPMVSDVAEKIPRSLRNILMRGLSQRPGERYATMRALIESIEAARRRPARIAGVGLGVGLVGLIAGAVVYAQHSTVLPPDACPAPILSAEAVWTPAKRALMPDRVAAQFDRKIDLWRRHREEACRSDSAELRRVRAACLDAVISTIDLAVKAMSSVDESTRRASDVTDLAGWSEACMQPTVPNLRVLTPERSSPAAVLLLRSLTFAQISDGEMSSAVDLAGSGCDRASALYAKAVVNRSKASFGRLTAAAEDAIDACDDDYLRARVAVLRALRTETPFYGPEQLALLRKATAAVARVSDTSMLSHLELVRGRAAYSNSAFDTAIELFGRAEKLAATGDDSRAAYEAQWLAISVRADRGRADDLEGLVATGRAVYERMVQDYGVTSSNLWPFRQALAALEWRAGNLDRSRNLLAEALAEPRRPDVGATRSVRGKIVDERGQPLAGVMVLAIGAEKTADVDGVDLALWQRSTLEEVTRAVSAEDGSFSLNTVASDALVLARTKGRSTPVTKVTKAMNDLTLRATPTGTIYGDIDYAGNSRYATRASVGSGRKGFHFIAPVAEDGRYEVENVPTGWYEVRTVTGKMSGISMVGKRIKIEPGRRKAPINFGQSQGEGKVHVIVRNERAGALDVAQIYVLRGRVQVSTVRDLRPVLDSSGSTSLTLARQVVGERYPGPAMQYLRPGDLFASIEHLDAGLLSLCAIGLSGDLGAEDFLEKLQDSSDKLDVRCTSVTLKKDGEEVVQISVPPMVRLD